MADRVSSPLSSSPGRHSALSRPNWPWAHPSYAHRSSPALVHSPGVGPSSHTPDSTLRNATSMNDVHSPAVPWNTSGRQSAVPELYPYSGPSQQDSTRQWSFSAFEWTVRDARKLRDFLETGEQTSQSEEAVSSEEGSTHAEFEILRESPIINDGKFKLEIARTPVSEGDVAGSSKTDQPVLSVYITSLMLDYPHSCVNVPATMLTAIRCDGERSGERGARTQWIFEHWQRDWTFRHGSEVWECPLPPISELLDNPSVQATDSFVICVQIHSPTGPLFPQQPKAHYVPRSLLEGLEALLDNSNTGDVRFVCLERLNQQPHSPSVSPGDTNARSKSRSSTSSSQSMLSGKTIARKRVIYGHADILSRRSEYFATMLASAFSETTPGPAHGERKIYNIVVEEADFETIYWLLKWVYADWVSFKEREDPRDAVAGVGAGWSANWLNYRGGEWAWKTLRTHESSEDSCLSPADDVTTSLSSGGTPHSGKGKQPFSSTGTPPRSLAKAPAGKPTASVTQAARTSSTSNSAASPSGLGVSTSSFNPTQRYASSSQQRQHSTIAASPDPHPHPTPAPPPASALAMYTAAHRYAMPDLANLALEHLMCTITPESSFALLLASSVWDELRLLIEDYVVDNWDLVSVSDEFEMCCQEVAAGEWGENGGKTLMGLFRRLRSPSFSRQ